MISFLTAALALLLAAPPASTGAPLPPPGREPTGGVEMMREDELFEYRYAYPAEAAAIQPLSQMLQAEAQKIEADTSETARDAKAGSERDAFPFHKHSFEKDWGVTADTPALLGLSATIYSFSGGAHGNSGFETLIWSRRSGKEVQLRDLFTDPDRVIAALTAPYCTALDAERAVRREGERLDSFEDCPKLDETMPVAPIARGGKIAAFQMLLGPYVAGPYSEGSYEIEVPVTDEVKALVKPEYRAAF